MSSLPAMHADPAAPLRAVDELLRLGRVPEAVTMLVKLTGEHPDELFYYAHLAALLERLGDVEAAIGHYARLLARQPGLASAHFNVALLYRKSGRFDDAIAAYEKAIELGLEGVEEVYSNLGVLYAELRRPDDARGCYAKALDSRPDYVPALYNLAGLNEECGERDTAIELYERILDVDPEHWDSLIRLAHVRRASKAGDPLLDRLRAGQQHAKDPLAAEGLRFAEGKILDDLRRHDEAFAAFKDANALTRQRQAPYDRTAAESARAAICRFFDSSRIESLASESQATPIFICGMFRSGSTLLEQILGAHPQIEAGGELDLLPRLMTKQLAPYPQRLETATPADLKAAADEYLRLRAELIPDAPLVTDKRPDNLIHLGLIRALFPRARIIHTRRDKHDNCLSVYFQHLGGNLNYANDLAEIAHYYEQQNALVEHWAGIMPGNLYSVSYDELVADPEPVVRGVLEFVGVDWSDRCLDFHRAEAQVSTASIWQVREPLHRRSSGRCKNYPEAVTALEAE
ncbi:MAG: sulfotransferase [Pseudomonadota bacterium]